MVWYHTKFESVTNLAGEAGGPGSTPTPLPLLGLAKRLGGLSTSVGSVLLAVLGYCLAIWDVGRGCVGLAYLALLTSLLMLPPRLVQAPFL